MACLIAAPASGSGKTLLSLSLIAYARSRGKSLQPFKVGPDYLDPQLLTAAAERPCRNLDLPLCGEAWVRDSFHGHGGRAELCLVEGVMGLYDGIGPTSEGSSAAVARLLELPVVLVVDAGGQAQSLAALVRGFQLHDPKLNLAGVVLNRVSTPRHRQLMQDVLDGIGVPLLGCLPRTVELSLPSRHLGLAPAHEIETFRQRLGAWAKLAEDHLDLNALLPLLQAPVLGPDPVHQQMERQPQSAALEPIPVAVAMDQAFHFRYPEMQDWLDALAMPVLPWQPLADEPPPAEAQGLILPGGFPELHARDLSQCKHSLEGLRQWVGQKPIYAECGGMLLMGQSLTDEEGEAHAMAGVLPFHAQKGQLQVGYRKLQADQDGLLLRRGDVLTGHEFHRWKLTADSPDAIDSKLSAGSVGNLESLWQVEGWQVPRRREGWNHPRLHASWVHLHWGGCWTISCRWRAAVETATARSKVASSPGRSPDRRSSENAGD
ncbi:cobyrinate a,c-diamide synthase [Synechococcus sp. MIT S9451]|uniref:cobyrinate a,c-diamide synthase n=1 Tax=Synechococcus sp. MIT S9451 TaxID=3082543 RepID=UPI0039B69394